MKSLLSIVTVSFAVLACSKAPPPSQGAPNTEPKAAERHQVVVSAKLAETGRVTVEAAKRSSTREELTVTGEIVPPPDGAAEIGAPIAGRVQSVRVKEGDHVEKGASLVVLEAAEVARTTTDLGRATARRDRAERILQQEEQLMREKATSERNLAEARSELAMANAEARGASSLLSTFSAAGGGRIDLKSPIAGTVVTRSVVLGKSVDPGALLFRVVDVSRLAVRADVPENDAADVTLGSAATLTWSVRRVACKATVESRAPSVDPVTRTVPFRVRPDKDCPELVDGGFVDVTLGRAGAEEGSLVAVSRDAIVELDGVPVVFVATGKPGEYRAVTVRVARLLANTAYLEEGVNVGDSVVTTGAILLKGELMRSALE